MDEQAKQITQLQNDVKMLQQQMATHAHTGARDTRISDDNVIPSIRASGSITMSTDGVTYKLGLISNPKTINFYGFAVYNPSSVSIRSHVVGSAQLGKSFYFQPQDATSVTTGGLPQDIIQSSSAFTIDQAGPTFRATVSEGHMISVEYPAGTIVARATVTKFQVDHVEVLVQLAASWSIIGNFVVT